MTELTHLIAPARCQFDSGFRCVFAGGSGGGPRFRVWVSWFSDSVCSSRCDCCVSGSPGNAALLQQSGRALLHAQSPIPPRAWGAGAGPASSETPKPAVLYFVVTFPQSCCRVRRFGLGNIPPSFLRDHLRSLHMQRFPDFRRRIHNNVLPGSESVFIRFCSLQGR